MPSSIGRISSHSPSLSGVSFSASSQQKLTILSPSNVSATHQNFSTTQPPIDDDPKCHQDLTSDDNLFKPLKPDPFSHLPTSFTGQSFLEHIGAAKAVDPSNVLLSQQSTPTSTILANPAGVIGGEFHLRRNKEIKHPKPLQQQPSGTYCY